MREPQIVREHHTPEPAELLEVADTVTDLRKVAHGRDAGVLAEKGIDH